MNSLPMVSSSFAICRLASARRRHCSPRARKSSASLSVCGMSSSLIRFNRCHSGPRGAAASKLRVSWHSTTKQASSFGQLSVKWQVEQRFAGPRGPLYRTLSLGDESGTLQIAGESIDNCARIKEFFEAAPQIVAPRGIDSNEPIKRVTCRCPIAAL